MTINNSDPLARLSDQELLSQVKALAGREREATARLIASLAELDARRLYLGEGCASLFTYCTQVLSLSEHAAYGRIEAARAARRFPAILDRLADGSATLTTIGLIAPHLTTANHEARLAAICHKSKREVECLVAAIRPQPAVASSVRKLPQPVLTPPVVTTPLAAVPVATDAVVGPPASIPALPVPARAPSAAVVSPLGLERYKVQFTVSRETYDELRHAQDLLRHTLPTGDPGVIFARALTLLVAELERTKLAATARPRTAKPTAQGSRHIPAAVKREVWARDGGHCAFVGTHNRCPERGFLEFHHVVPYAEGGASTTGNVQVRCRAHNAYEAEQWFGPTESWVLRELRPVFGSAAETGITTLTSAQTDTTGPSVMPGMRST